MVRTLPYHQITGIMGLTTVGYFNLHLSGFQYLKVTQRKKKKYRVRPRIELSLRVTWKGLFFRV
jgi:hypothetical protein